MSFVNVQLKDKRNKGILRCGDLIVVNESNIFMLVTNADKDLKALVIKSTGGILGELHQSYDSENAVYINHNIKTWADIEMLFGCKVRTLNTSEYELIIKEL